MLRSICAEIWQATREVSIVIDLPKLGFGYTVRGKIVRVPAFLWALCRLAFLLARQTPTVLQAMMQRGRYH